MEGEDPMFGMCELCWLEMANDMEAEYEYMKNEMSMVDNTNDYNKLEEYE